MSKPKPPKSPDPYQISGADYAYNNPSQYTPYGSLVNTAPQFAGIGANKRVVSPGSQTLNLSPELQEILNKQLKVSGITLNQALNRQGELSNLGELPTPDRGFYEQQLFQRQRGLLDPIFAEQERSMRDRLSNQGLAPTSEAYGYDQSQFFNERNQAYERAAMESSIGAGGYMGQEIANAGALRSIPFNEIASLLGIQQVQPPNIGNFSQGSGGDFSGAQALTNQNAMQRYQAASGQYSNTMSAAAGLAAALGSAAIAASDRRLKKNINLIGKVGRHNWYSFEYLSGGKAEGVMADEVLADGVNADAVMADESGYLMVDYGKLT